jgi:hypothetical protein
MSSLSIFRNMFMGNNCGMDKLVPANRVETFAVRHFYQGRHPQWNAVHLSDQRLRSGKNYLTNMNLNVPECWRDLNETAHLPGALRLRRRLRIRQPDQLIDVS